MNLKDETEVALNFVVGRNCFVHCHELADNVPEKCRPAAWLHHCLTDGFCTPAGLNDLGLSKETVEMLAALTPRVDEAEPDHIKRIVANGLAAIVKYKDACTPAMREAMTEARDRIRYMVFSGLSGWPKVEWSFAGRPKCPSSGMARFSGPYGQAEKHIIYGRYDRYGNEDLATRRIMYTITPGLCCPPDFLLY